MSNDKQNWVAVGLIAIISVLNLSVLALCLHNGYETVGQLTWRAWRFFAFLNVFALLILCRFRETGFFLLLFMFTLFSWLLLPGAYVYLVIYEGQFSVSSMEFLSVAPYFSTLSILIISSVIFIAETEVH